MSARAAVARAPGRLVLLFASGRARACLSGRSSSLVGRVEGGVPVARCCGVLVVWSVSGSVSLCGASAPTFPDMGLRAKTLRVCDADEKMCGACV